MSFEIVHRYTKALIYKSETASTVGEAAKEAIEKRADLTGADLTGADLARAYLARADLTGAYLTGADLTGAYLARADLTRADLTGADLARANLTGANLTRAYLTRADLTGADLTGAYLAGADLTGADLAGADLARADLTGANLTRAYLTRADLTGANLTGAEEDFYKILDAATPEVPALLSALRAGKVDGSTYEGECACLVGTIANARGCSFRSLGDGLLPDSGRPAERLFLAIRKGSTPENNPVAKIIEGWIGEWQAKSNNSQTAAQPQEMK